MDNHEEQNAARGRFKNVVQTSDLPNREWARDTQRYGAVGKEAALAIGATQLGYSVVSLDPGKSSCPYHFHHSEEEMFYCLTGKGVLRQGDKDGEEELELQAGDFVAFPAGTGIAHQFINRGDEAFVYMAVSNRVKADVAEYPDSDKVLMRQTGMMLRREPTLQYFDGEL